ncbi:MAG: DUF58 domain-containing protein, partial [Deltaproteobacteria bacterium]
MNLFRRRPNPAPAAAPAQDDPFDEAFLSRLALLEVVARRMFRGRHRAERKTRKVGSGLEFADHREYTPGDDIRNLDWNVYMRLGQTLVRLFEEDEDLPIRIVVDRSASMGTSGGVKFEYARKVAAALAYVGLSNLDRVGITCASASEHATLPPARGKGRIFRVFEFLRRIEPSGPTDLRAACARVAAESPDPGLVVVLSDFYDVEGAFDAVNLLRFRKHEPVAVQILAPEEAHPSAEAIRGDVTLEDAEGGLHTDVTLDDRAVARFAAAHERFCQALERNCRTRGIAYFRAPVSIPFDDLVLRM